MTDDLPKCLLAIGGKTILERTMENLFIANVQNIAVVVGFESEKIQAHLRDKFPKQKFRFILNPNFASTNNAYSLLLARDFFLEPIERSRRKDALLILDSDIVFHGKIMLALLGNTSENRIAVRKRGDHDIEEIGVRVDNSEQITAIGKRIPVEHTKGESIGIEFFRYEDGKLLFEVLEGRVHRGSGKTEYYEAAFQEMIDLGIHIKAVDVSRFPSIEIDSPDDLERARQIIVPMIDATSDVRLR